MFSERMGGGPDSDRLAMDALGPCFSWFNRHIITKVIQGPFQLGLEQGFSLSDLVLKDFDRFHDEKLKIFGSCLPS